MRLGELVGVGPATLDDFRALGVDSVETLASCDPDQLYTRLCDLKGRLIDPCCADVFSCAVAQARDPELPEAQKQWWYWSRVRKAADGAVFPNTGHE